MSDRELCEAPLEPTEVDANSADGAKIDGPPHDEAPQREALPNASIVGARIGVLVGFLDEGRTPLVIFPGQRNSAAVSARATLDLHGAHVGRDVVLTFEDGDPEQPIVVGCLPKKDASWPLTEQLGRVDVDVDGERMVVTAKEQLVLRCGAASITLTKAGKILIQGAYVSSHSSGVNRVKGGSVQIN
jgi:hypothetical protein